MSAAATALELRVLSSFEELEAVEDAWWMLWRRDPAATPFQTPAWLLPWTRWLWGGGRIRVLALRNAGELVALAPLFFWGYGAQPEAIHVSFLGSGITDYLGIIALPEVADEAAALVLSWLAGHREEWSDADLQELRENAPLLRAEVPDLWASREECSVCPVAPLPEDPAEFEAGLDAKFRRNLRNAAHRIANEAGLEFVTAQEDQVQDFLRALFEVHAARWEERDQNGMLATERLQKFHLEAAAALFRAGIARLHALRINGRIVAVQYNLLAGSRLYLYLSGFDPKWSRLSPGALLLKESIAAAIAEGAREADFLRNAEEFKYLWGARDRINYRLRLSQLRLSPTAAR
jgi:CelD/BcsL family acetyltransferase involved in cellulose biosynthesis